MEFYHGRSVSEMTLLKIYIFFMSKDQR